MDTVDKIMIGEVITVKPTDTLMRVKDLMLSNRINRLVVTENRKVTGIITRKDIIRSVLEKYREKDVDEMFVWEAMTKNPITVNPEIDISECAVKMLENKISSLIVVEEGELVGIVTKTDLCKYYFEELEGRLKVKDAMTRNVITAKPNQSIFYVIDLMNEHGISRVVVEEENKVIGVITTTDISLISAILNPMQVIKERKPITLLTERKGLIVSPTAASIFTLTARDVMTTNVITVRSDDDLAQAAKIMFENRISGLPVVDEEDKLVGIVTKTDITKAIATLPGS